MSGASEIVQDAHGALSDLDDTEITIYPVRAEEVGAFLGGGGKGVDLTRLAKLTRRATLNDDIRTDNLEEALRINDETAAQFSLKDSSISYGGRLYSIVRTISDHPGVIECWLEEYR